MRRQLPDETEIEPFPDPIDDLKGGIDPDMADLPASGVRADIPAWRRIEEYRELRDLNHRLEDDVYGHQPIRNLWDQDWN